MERQYTLQAAVSFSGRGLHTGEHAQLEIFPAADNHGFQFQRTDLKDKPVIPAHLDGVTGTARGTSLSYQGVEIHTVEHILAALVSLGIDNALIGVSGPEIPILDGSAREFVQQLQAVGRQAQQAEKTFAQVQEGLEFHDPQKDATYRISPADSFSIDTHIDFGNKSLGRQSAHLASLQSFPEEIAPARTFCFFHEIEHLRAANLIKGGSLKSALVFLDEVPTLAHREKFAQLFPGEKVEWAEGVLNKGGLRYSNEPARHKLLDVIGDLALLGKPLAFHVEATKPGHASNVALARFLSDKISPPKR